MIIKECDQSVTKNLHDSEFPSEKDVVDQSDSNEEVKASTSEPELKSAKQAAEDPDNSEKKVEVEQEDSAQKLASLEQDLKESQEQVLRVQAEMQNMQRRQQNERTQLLKYASQDLAKDILPVVDNLERALDVQVEGEAAQQLHKGVEMVLQHLQQALEHQDIQPVGEVGEKFNPNLHQAVQTIPADEDHQANTVVQVFQKGYQLKDRILRPAMVVVAQ